MSGDRLRTYLAYCGMVTLTLCLQAHRTAHAADVIFTIDPALSSATWSGSDDSFGPWQEQSAGSLTAPLSGHFLVRFDPFSGVPSTLQFVQGHGYYELGSPHTGSPGGTSANLAGTTAGGESQWAIRNLVWDFGSGEIAGEAGVFPVNQTHYTVISGGMDFDDAVDGAGFTPYAGLSDQLTGGTWTLSESAPGSGSWTLALDGHYDYQYAGAGSIRGSFSASGAAVATAQYGVDNVATLNDTQTTTEALGGAGTPGGVSATFSNATTGGVFSVQQVPNESGLSQAAVAAAATNPVFALSTDTLSANPQIWNVNFSGDLNGATVELVFHYDPTLLPPEVDPATLGIWHFNSNLQAWEFGGTVDPLAHTVTFVTDNFSPFQLGVLVPEPSTLLLAGMSACGLLWRGLRRRA